MLKTTVSTKGQVTLPKSAREQLGLEPGSQLEVVVEPGAIRLRKLEPRWRQWSGALQGSEALRDLEREHREEISRDESRLPRK
jgi:AbrB family looped-hinge helix DNA binding protein